jgi:hypothetical protein
VHEISSAYNSRNNGLAKALVKQLKALMRKSDLSRESYYAAPTEWGGTVRAD